jgi:hypothetical protein
MDSTHPFASFARLLPLALVLLSAGLAACGDDYACESQSVSGKPVEGCTDLSFGGCDNETCTVEFSQCGGDAPSVVCSGATCTCYEGDQEIGSCEYDPSECPMDIDIQLDGDDTSAMTFFESCCGATISGG